MKSPFPDVFIIVIDTILSDVYNKPIPRKDYLSFFEMFEKIISRNINEEFTSMEINNNVERIKWGRIKVNGKMIWKLDLMLKTLKEKRILESTGYLANIPNSKGHSRRFYFTESFLNELDYSSFSIVYEEINDKIYQTLKNQKSYDESDPQYQLLKSSRFTIDVDKCNEWLIETYKSNQISKESCLLNIRRVQDIFNKDIYVVKINNGRVYSSFNSLKKELRQFCYIDGEPLSNCDLKSSQPFLLATYLINKYPKNGDVQSFFDIVVNRDIYTWLMTKNNELFEEKIKGRDDCKPEFYRYLFKKTNKGVNNIQRIIQSVFPSMYNIIKNEKNSLAVEGNNLANLLQSVEAKLFIPVCEEFVDRGCLSVHDSLYFKSGIEDEIRSGLEGKFGQFEIIKYKIIYNIL
jgi:uncharacterized protein YqcC (DUF446 family)